MSRITEALIDWQNNTSIVGSACRDHEAASILTSGFQKKFNEVVYGNG
ncbi:MAG: hypothetical protein VYA69_15060 [Gemmatimonadota bacterium]|nr:hypothetical protein [Gemmatimonadota bacterium]